MSKPREYVRKPGQDGIPTWHTVSIEASDLSLFNRTQIMPVPEAWTCQYCRCINPPENVHCEHCGAPHVDQATQADVAATAEQLREIERLALRTKTLMQRLTESK